MHFTRASELGHTAQPKVRLPTSAANGRAKQEASEAWLSSPYSSERTGPSAPWPFGKASRGGELWAWRLSSARRCLKGRERQESPVKPVCHVRSATAPLNKKASVRLESLVMVRICILEAGAQPHPPAKLGMTGFGSAQGSLGLRVREMRWLVVRTTSWQIPLHDANRSRLKSAWPRQ